MLDAASSASARTASTSPTSSSRALPGLTVHDLMLLPIERCARVLRTSCICRRRSTKPTDLLLTEIRARLDYLRDVGLGYLTLDRQSRTLSGGEVQRINLTTALGTSLVNTLFVLDEPSIGLHPRDMGRVIGVMQRLRDAGNSLVVVEHDPQVMLAADRILDMGPGPGERGGEIVFFGTPEAAAAQRARSPATTSPGASARRMPARPQLGSPQPARRACELLGARRAQPEEHRRRDPAQAPGVRHRRVRLRQVDAGAGRAVSRRCCKHKGKPTEAPGAHRALARPRLHRRRRAGRPVADRPHHALQSRRATSAPSMRSASSSRSSRSRRSAATPPARSASTPATAAARPAAATASSTSRCSSCPTSTCAARTATASASAPRSSRVERCAGERGAQVDRRRARA